MNMDPDDVEQMIKSVESEGMTLDFSEFHPLDHALTTHRCGTLPGGRRRHLRLWWDWQAPDPAGRVLCLLGRHDLWDEIGNIGEPIGVVWCRRCGYIRDERH